jgi:anti-sigma regulatory factor (Ser/Thr protein kinase)
MDPLIVPALLESLPAIGRYLMEAAGAAGLDRRAAYRLRLAVDEIATNIVVHGAGLRRAAGCAGEPVIRVAVAGDESGVTVLVEDDGPAYDPREAAPPPDLDRPLVDRQVGGLGVYLATRAVDRFHYERIENRNRNRLTIRRAPPGADESRHQ